MQLLLVVYTRAFVKVALLLPLAYIEPKRVGNSKDFLSVAVLASNPGI